MKSILEYMKILHLSDTHGCHRRLTRMPEADILIHSGDVSLNGSEREVLDFLSWFCDLEGYRHKVWIGGNHDFCLAGASISGMNANCHYLCNSEIEIEGLTIYGVPLFMASTIVGKMKTLVDRIPSDTDILVSHQPPYGILDETIGVHYGSEALLAKVSAVQPRLHLFGHNHGGYGQYSHKWADTGNTTLFVNSVILNGDYELINEPQLIEV